MKMVPKVDVVVGSEVKLSTKSQSLWNDSPKSLKDHDSDLSLSENLLIVSGLTRSRESPSNQLRVTMGLEKSTTFIISILKRKFVQCCTS